MAALEQARIAEIRAENHQGDVAAKDIEWLCAEVERLQHQLEEALTARDHWLEQTQSMGEGRVRAEATVAQLRQALEEAQSWIEAEIRRAQEDSPGGSATEIGGRELHAKIVAALAGSVPATDTASEQAVLAARKPNATLVDRYRLGPAAGSTAEDTE